MARGSFINWLGRLFCVRSSDPPPFPCGVHRGTATGLDTLGDGDENLSSDPPPFPCGVHDGTATGSCTCGLDTLGDGSVDFYKFEELLRAFLDFPEQSHPDLVGKEKGITTDSIQEGAESSELREGAARIFSSDELWEAVHFFDPVRKLGQGGYGSVYLGKLKDGHMVAVKEMHGIVTDIEWNRFILEIDNFCNLRHPNLITLYGCTSVFSDLLLAYEYVTNGNVAEHIHEDGEAGRKVLTWDLRIQIAIETADALSFLHFCPGRTSIVHCDIKTDNILLDDNFHVKVCDFGLSSKWFSSHRGTLGYLDPEFDKVGLLTVKSDVYSFGVVLLELIYGKKAVDVYRDETYLVDMMTKEPLEQLVDRNIGYELDPDIRRMVNLVADLACLCLRSEGKKRPSMQEVLWNLKGIRDNKDRVIEHIDDSSPDQAPAHDTSDISNIAQFICDVLDISNPLQFFRHTNPGYFERLSNSCGHKLSTVVLFVSFLDPELHTQPDGTSCSCRLYLQDNRFLEGMTSSMCFFKAVASYILTLAAVNEIPLQVAQRTYSWVTISTLELAYSRSEGTNWFESQS